MTRESIHDWFSRAAAGCEQNIAIDMGDRQVTYAALEAQSNRLANVFVASGTPRDATVAILLDDVSQVITAVLAALKAGVVFVPLDPRTPERRLAALVEEVSIERFATEAKYTPLVSRIAGAAAPTVTLIEDIDASTSSSRPAVERTPDDMCYVYFTSGSTGRPKGIAGRLKAIDHYIRWETGTFGISAGDRVSQLTTPSFDASLRDFFAPLAVGGTVCVPPAGTVLDAETLVDWIHRERINILHCVPSVFRALLNEPLDASRFPALRHVLMAGEAILPADASKWFGIFGDRISLVNLYGPSETTMTKFFHVVTPEDAHRRLIPIGKPMPGASAIVVDEHNHPCPAGVVGEIYIRTPYRSLGYYRRPDLTSAVFIPNPFGSDPNDLVYKTGDLGRLLKDGSFELIGRRDHQVKVRGERIELGAIETALRTHEAIKDVVVVDRDDATGTKYLCGYVVASREVAVPELRDFLAGELSAAAIPSAFVTLDAIPRLINGKVDRAALPVPDRDRARAEQTFEPPRTPVEEKLAQLFADVLAVSRVGIHESFFDLGGHSLLATQLVSRIRRGFEIALPVRALFDTPTVAGIARHVDAASWAAQKPAASASAAVTELEI
jgi:amino acid adenylation domain-containing protein